MRHKKLSEFASKNNIGGLEFLSCIPGTIGGGLKMNSGCFKKEFKDILVSVQAVDKTGKVLTIPSSKIKFGYRKNDLDKNLIRSMESDNRVADCTKAQKILNIL